MSTAAALHALGAIVRAHAQVVSYAAGSRALVADIPVLASTLHRSRLALGWLQASPGPVDPLRSWFVQQELP